MYTTIIHGSNIPAQITPAIPIKFDYQKWNSTGCLLPETFNWASLLNYTRIQHVLAAIINSGKLSSAGPSNERIKLVKC